MSQSTCRANLRKNPNALTAVQDNYWHSANKDFLTYAYETIGTNSPGYDTWYQHPPGHSIYYGDLALEQIVDRDPILDTECKELTNTTCQYKEKPCIFVTDTCVGNVFFTNQGNTGYDPEAKLPTELTKFCHTECGDECSQDKCNKLSMVQLFPGIYESYNSCESVDPSCEHCGFYFNPDTGMRIGDTVNISNANLQMNYKWTNSTHGPVPSNNTPYFSHDRETLKQFSENHDDGTTSEFCCNTIDPMNGVPFSNLDVTRTKLPGGQSACDPNRCSYGEDRNTSNYDNNLTGGSCFKDDCPSTSASLNNMLPLGAPRGLMMGQSACKSPTDRAPGGCGNYDTLSYCVPCAPITSTGSSPSEYVCGVTPGGDTEANYGASVAGVGCHAPRACPECSNTNVCDESYCQVMGTDPWGNMLAGRTESTTLPRLQNGGLDNALPGKPITTAPFMLGAPYTSQCKAANAVGCSDLVDPNDDLSPGRAPPLVKSYHYIANGMRYHLAAVDKKEVEWNDPASTPFKLESKPKTNEYISSMWNTTDWTQYCNLTTLDDKKKYVTCDMQYLRGQGKDEGSVDNNEKNASITHMRFYNFTHPKYAQSSATVSSE